MSAATASPRRCNAEGGIPGRLAQQMAKPFARKRRTRDLDVLGLVFQTVTERRASCFIRCPSAMSSPRNAGTHQPPALVVEFDVAPARYTHLPVVIGPGSAPDNALRCRAWPGRQLHLARSTSHHSANMCRSVSAIVSMPHMLMRWQTHSRSLPAHSWTKRVKTPRRVQIRYRYGNLRVIYVVDTLLSFLWRLA
jgi:hypothetical protein